MVQKTMKALEARLAQGEGQAEITIKRSGEKLWIYQQDSGFAVYFDEGNIWKSPKADPVFFPFRQNGLQKLAEFILAR